jgi:hypothetical protein
MRAPQWSDLDLLCDLYGVIDFDPWIANCTLQFRVIEKMPDGTQVPRFAVDACSRRSAHLAQMDRKPDSEKRDQQPDAEAEPATTRAWRARCEVVTRRETRTLDAIAEHGSTRVPSLHGA